MNYFSIVVGQIGMFIIYALIGIIAVKRNILNRDGLNMISRMITRILLPLMLFTNTVNGTTKEEFIESAWMMLAAVVYYLALYAVGFCLKKAFRKTGDEGNVYHACTTFSNIGFMGIPVVMALFPERGILYITLFTVVDMTVLWTFGVNLTLPIDGGIRYTPVQKLKKMINPCTISIFLSVLVVFTGIKVPDLLNTAFTKTGAATTPFALIYLGGVFCYVNILDYVKKSEIYGSVLVKQVILPIVLLVIFRHFPGLTEEMAVTLAILSAMPTMTTIAMLAQNQKSAGDYAAGMIFLTTVLSVITLPFVCFLL